MRVINSIPLNTQKEKELGQCLSSSSDTRRGMELFHSMEMHKMLQFPETRLVQYDCGKKNLCHNKAEIKYLILSLRMVKSTMANFSPNQFR